MEQGQQAGNESPTYLSTPLGDVVRAWRDYRRLRPSELANVAEMPKQLLSEIERNKTRNTGSDNLVRIAAALGVSPFVLSTRLFPSDALKYVPELVVNTSQQQQECRTVNVKRDDGEVMQAVARALQRGADSVWGAPVSLADALEEQPPSFGNEVAAIVANFHLPYAERKRAQHLICETARAICKGIQDDLAGRHDSANH